MYHLIICLQRESWIGGIDGWFPGTSKKCLVCPSREVTTLVWVNAIEGAKERLGKHDECENEPETAMFSSAKTDTGSSGMHT